MADANVAPEQEVRGRPNAPRRITPDMPLDGQCTHGWLEIGGNTRCPNPATTTRMFAPTGRDYPCCDDHKEF